MKNVSKQRMGMMGKFHNEIVELIDSSQLTPTETVMVLNSISKHITELFQTMAEAK